MMNKRNLGRSLLAALVVVAVASTLWRPAVPQVGAQQIHRNGFENPKLSWAKGAADVPFQELEHIVTNQNSHDGQQAEYIKINAEQGSHIHYQYPSGRAVISAELEASVWIKANRPGLQVLARVVLPNERDPSNLDAPLTTYLRGDVYRLAGRWQRLALGRSVQLAQQQQQIMQNQLKRSINFSDAYVDTLILNVYGGPGPTEVWIDDLEVGPILADPNLQPGVGPRSPAGQPAHPGPASTRSQVVEFNGTQLLVGGKPFFFRGIRHTDTPLRVLRDAGFNTVLFDYTSDPKLVREAADLGFWLAPTMQVMANDSRLSSAEGVRQEMGRFTENDAVLFWHLGGTLAFEQTAAVARTTQFMKTVDPGRPVGADVWDGLRAYARSLQLLGIHRWPLMTTLELSRYGEWLTQRRRLASGSFLWTWVQTHLPDWYSYLLYNQSGSTAFKEPVGPQPEQVRLMIYMAIGSGCRGLGFWSDRFLSDGHFGRDRLLCLALLNQELEMIEPLLVSETDRPEWIETSVKEVKAAVIRGPKGVLVLPIWQGGGSQYVPGQSAVGKLILTVPQVPQSHQAWEVAPGEVRGLRAERVVGGTKVTLPEFGLTAAVAFTSDTALVVRFQEQARSRRQLAAQWTYDMALYELEKVLRVEERLENQGHTLPDGKHLIEDAQNRLRTAKQHWDSRLFSEAYHESQRALRPLRILMRAQWEAAVKALDSPVSSPYAVSFFTLPRHWDFVDEVGKSIATANVLPGGDFEIIPERVQDSWRPEEPTLDEVELLAKRVTDVHIPLGAKPGAVKPGLAPTTVEAPHQGKQCLMLQVKPKNPTGPGGANLAPQALERTLLAITSPVVHLQPGSLVQISAWVRIPQKITATADGALLYDSAGGEPLAIRLTEPMPWKKLTLFRRVPDSGTLHVTLAMTGIGSVYFDDVRIEPLVPGGTARGLSGL